MILIFMQKYTCINILVANKSILSELSKNILLNVLLISKTFFLTSYKVLNDKDTELIKIML